MMRRVAGVWVDFKRDGCLRMMLLMGVLLQATWLLLSSRCCTPVK